MVVRPADPIEFLYHPRKVAEDSFPSPSNSNSNSNTALVRLSTSDFGPRTSDFPQSRAPPRRRGTVSAPPLRYNLLPIPHLQDARGAAMDPTVPPTAPGSPAAGDLVTRLNKLGLACDAVPLDEL